MSDFTATAESVENKSPLADTSKTATKGNKGHSCSVTFQVENIFDGEQHSISSSPNGRTLRTSENFGAVHFAL
jgi:hypothetical protein